MFSLVKEGRQDNVSDCGGWEMWCSLEVAA